MRKALWIGMLALLPGLSLAAGGAFAQPAPAHPIEEGDPAESVWRAAIVEADDDRTALERPGVGPIADVKIWNAHKLPPPLHSGRLTVVFGDSDAHFRHNVRVVAVGGVITMGALWALPDRITGFTSPRPSLDNFKEAFTKPPLWSDGDWWFWNLFGHPFIGTHQYLLERNWGESQLRSFAFSAASSLVWEYGFESWIERPSVEDMLLTAPTGWVLGETIYRLTQYLRRDGLSGPEKVVVFVLNPGYVLQHGFR